MKTIYKDILNNYSEYPKEDLINLILYKDAQINNLIKDSYQGQVIVNHYSNDLDTNREVTSDYKYPCNFKQKQAYNLVSDSFNIADFTNAYIQVGGSQSSVGSALKKLIKKGVVKRIDMGNYEKVNKSNEVQSIQ